MGLLAVAFGLLTTSCAGFVLRQDVESARTDWTINPSDQRATIYAEALHDAFAAAPTRTRRPSSDGVRAKRWRPSAPAESRSGPQLATLIADRGLLLLDLGRNHEGWAELQRSMAVAPTLVAARGIVSVWGARRRSDEVGEACARTLPAMREPDSRFQLLDLCVKNMHATTEAAALAWAPPEALAFYRDERARRELLAQQAAQMAAMDQAMQAAQTANDQAQQAAQIANQAPMAAAHRRPRWRATPAVTRTGTRSSGSIFR